MVTSLTLCLAALLDLLGPFTAASKSSAGGHHPTPPTKHCTVKHNHNGADDSANILQAFKDCSTNSIITFAPANYSAYTPITLAKLDNVIIHLNGNLLLPNNMSKVQHEINITTNQRSTYATPWFYFHGSNVQLIGAADFGWGRFYGFGQHWWDLGNRTLRPQLATFNVTNGLLRNLKSFPFNTDGINISGTNVTVDGYYGHNGDDCISVINGARNVFATNGFCGFYSHGLSIRSLGKNGSFQTVQGVFKSWTGGAGFADNVTWEDITIVNVSTAIFVTQKSDLGAPPNTTSNRSTQISNFKFKNFKGSLNANWNATQSIIFNLYPRTALNISVGKIDVHPFEKAPSATTIICDPKTLAPGKQDTLRFNCTRGPYVATPILQ
ncbi:pectin lyase fold/virulence factor [Mycena crocata]|nr:pectin lyase fold/virulence factor [Mycena crocata]